MLTHRLQDSAHLFTLPLGSDVGSNPFLQELQASLVFRNTQQFHGPFFIRRESNNFSDQITNKLIVVGLLALVVWRFLLPFNGGGLVTFVETSANFVFGRHAKEGTNNVVKELLLFEALLPWTQISLWGFWKDRCALHMFTEIYRGTYIFSAIFREPEKGFKIHRIILFKGKDCTSCRETL